MVFCELFCEDSKEWKMKFDILGTERIMQRYGMKLPLSVIQRRTHLHNFAKILAKRSDFDDEDFVFGYPVLTKIREIKREHKLPFYLKKEKRIKD